MKKCPTKATTYNRWSRSSKLPQSGSLSLPLLLLTVCSRKHPATKMIARSPSLAPLIQRLEEESLDDDADFVLLSEPKALMTCRNVSIVLVRKEMDVCNHFRFLSCTSRDVVGSMTFLSVME